MELKRIAFFSMNHIEFLVVKFLVAFLVFKQFNKEMMFTMNSSSFLFSVVSWFFFLNLFIWRLNYNFSSNRNSCYGINFFNFHFKSRISNIDYKFKPPDHTSHLNFMRILKFPKNTHIYLK